MATDSSSGTLPSSRRLTIDSSSSIARSKLSVFTSTWVFSAILRSRLRPFICANPTIFLRGYCGGDSRAHQCRDVGRHRLFQALQVVTAFEDRDHAIARAGVGDIHQLARDPAEVFRVQIDVGEGIAAMGVEACGNHDEFGGEFLQLGQNQVYESCAEFGCSV